MLPAPTQTYATTEATGVPQVRRVQKDEKATRQRDVAGGVIVLDGCKSLMTVWSPIRDLGVWGGLDCLSV